MDRLREDHTVKRLRKCLKDCDGIIVPGGFGDRGIEGMIDSHSNMPD